jgi:hypothetical protein
VIADSRALQDPCPSRKAGYTFSHPDLIIAATALCPGLTILSRDTGDYERARAPVANPWR